MATDTKDRFIDVSADLLRRQGYASTGVKQIVRAAKAPLGSLYHHFPGGKDELVAAAMEETLTRALNLLSSKSGASAIEIAEFFLDAWRVLLTRSELRAGCALAAVAVATGSDQLRQQAGEAFRLWRAHLAELLERGGLPADSAPRHATLLLAASEGAVVMSRAQGDLSAFESVAASLLEGIRRELPSVGG